MLQPRRSGAARTGPDHPEPLDWELRIEPCKDVVWKELAQGEAWTLQYESANQSSREIVRDSADSVLRISMPKSTFLQTSMNMVSGLRRGGLLIDADVFVWREVWPERGCSLKAVDARRLHSTNHKAGLASSQHRVIEEQTPACATTRFLQIWATRREWTFAR